MNISARELGYAEGMVERRSKQAESIGKSASKKEAMSIYRSMTACIKEVSKHYRNILRSVDNESAGHAIDAIALVHTARSWHEKSLEELSAWGVTNDEVRTINTEVGWDNSVVC